MNRSVPGLLTRRACLLCALLGCIGGLARAERSPVAFESTYLGDGWFEYSAITTDDPFFLFLDVAGAAVQFGDVLEAGPPPAQWTNMFFADSVSWGFDGIALGAQTRPYRATFRLRSVHTTFKRVPAGGVVLMSLSIVGGYHGHFASANIVGYWTPDVLVPCPPEEAEGSTTNLLLWCPMISNLPQPRMVDVSRSGGDPRGIAFEYPEPSTVRLEGTRDFRAWTNITYIHGQAGVTAWTTNVPLPNYGDFFRVRLVAEGHATNMPPLDSASATIAARKTGYISGGPTVICRPTSGEVQLTIRSTPGKTYGISAMDRALRPAGHSEVKATRGTTTVRLPAPDQTVGLYEVRELP